jgi:hypothetical protein
MKKSCTQFTVIDGGGSEFRENIGRQLVSAILKRDDAKYDELRHVLHPAVSLAVVTSSCNIQREPVILHHTS